jgi:predicted nucleotidyltransferase
MSELDHQLAQLDQEASPQVEARQDWWVELDEWALAYAQRLSRGVGTGGVLIGGSIARGEQWEHSDLEVAVLVETVDPTLPHFSVDNRRGVELFQLEKHQLEEQVAAVEGGDLGAVASWPTQLYRSRVVHDPSGLLARFVAAFDRHLFSDAVRGLKLEAHRRVQRR